MSEWLVKLGNPWAVLGLTGQCLFFARWIVQWAVSEKRKESHVPLSFWIISLSGGLLVLVYAIHQKDFVFVLGQSVGIANYIRNIMLIRKRPNV